MLARVRKQLNHEDKGFTLIELLVVMIIIGILAAVAIPIFLSQRKKAQDTAAKSDVGILGKEIGTWFVDGTGLPYVNGDGSEYVLGADSASAEKVGNQSDNVQFGGIEGTNATDWCVWVYNVQGDVAASDGFEYSASGGLQAGSCSTATVPSS